MTDQSARERIAAAIGDVYKLGMMHERNEPHYYSPYSEADRVIAIVREALLSQNALEAAADIWNNHHAPTCDRSIQAACEEAFGTDDDGVYPAGTHLVDIMKGEMKRRCIGHETESLR